MRNVYLIDFENVGSEGLAGVAGLTEEDMVVLFYSVKSDKIAIRTHIQIGKSPAQFEYAEVTVGGKNALDHQLATYLGFLVAKDEAQRYFIVSRDNGYQYISKFWAKKAENACVECIPSIRCSLQQNEGQGKDRMNQGKPQVQYPFKGPAQSQAAPQAVSQGQPQNPVQPREQPQPQEAPKALVPTAAATKAEQLQAAAAPLPAAAPVQAQQPQREVREKPAVQVREQSQPAAAQGQRKAAQPKEQPQPAAQPENKGQAEPGQGGKTLKTKAQPGSKKAKGKTAPRTAGLEKPFSPSPEEKRQVDDLLGAHPGLPIDVIHTLILAGSKQKLCNSLRKTLGQEKGLELYNGIKSILWK